MTVWQLFNETPFSVGYNACMDHRTGGARWDMAVKGTFDISEDGMLQISNKQVAVFSSSEFYDREDNSSIKYHSDLEAQSKDRIDILVNAHAYAPEGKAVTELDVGVTVGTWTKQLKIIGNRYWDKSMGVMFKTMPTKFEKKPIIYEKAFGGTADSKNGPVVFPENPVGTGYALKRSCRVGQTLPNVEYPKHSDKNGKSQNNRVAGLGPICSHWQPRSTLAGTFDDTWRETRCPLLPVDFDPLYYQCAPLDQQLPQILGGEPVRLKNLTPGTGSLEFHLPDIDLSFYTKIGKEVESHRSSLHAIIIEPDYPRVQMIWHTSVNCINREHEVEHTYIESNIKSL